MRRDKGQVKIEPTDIIGKRLGKLEVVAYKGHNYDITLGGERMRHHYECKCDCGTVKVLQRGQLTSEIVHSCGCSRMRNRHGY